MPRPPLPRALLGCWGAACMARGPRPSPHFPGCMAPARVVLRRARAWAKHREIAAFQLPQPRSARSALGRGGAAPPYRATTFFWCFFLPKSGVQTATARAGDLRRARAWAKHREIRPSNFHSSRAPVRPSGGVVPDPPIGPDIFLVFFFHPNREYKPLRHARVT